MYCIWIMRGPRCVWDKCSWWTDVGPTEIMSPACHRWSDGQTDVGPIATVAGGPTEGLPLAHQSCAIWGSFRCIILQCYRILMNNEMDTYCPLTILAYR